MSALVPGNKIEAIELLDAEIRIIGRSQDDAQVEVVEDMPAAETVFVPQSGASLIACIAVLSPECSPSRG